MLRKKIFDTIFKPLAKIYLGFNVNYKFDGFKLKVFAGVFHPGFFFSTNYFYSFINKLALSNKSFLELGCGSGLLSMLAYRKGAMVSAVDIDYKAVENTKLNFEKNFGNTYKAKIIESNLFDELQIQTFDIVVINPPYFFVGVEEPKHYAWRCGNDGEYFVKLFSELKNYTHANSEVYMVLAQNCDIDRIRQIASGNNISFVLIEQKKIKWEVNYIFSLKLEP